jgi:hypothetical protein
VSTGAGRSHRKTTVKVTRLDEASIGGKPDIGYYLTYRPQEVVAMLREVIAQAELEL